MCEVGVIYNSIKQQVNELGNGLKQTVQGHLEENNKKEFKDRKGNTIEMDKVGLSTGVYIPGGEYGFTKGSLIRKADGSLNKTNIAAAQLAPVSLNKEKTVEKLCLKAHRTFKHNK